MKEVLEFLNQYPTVAAVVLAIATLVVAGQAYVGATPTEKDDAWFAKLEANAILGPILKALKAFAPIQRKEKKD